MPLPDKKLDHGNRHLHFGWHAQPSNGLWAYGVFIENGCLEDNSPNGKFKSMVRDIMNKYPVEFMITPNQDVLFTNILEDAKNDFEGHLKSCGWGEMEESIGITGYERQCFRPATKRIGLVGSGLDRYQFKLFGDETSRFQGKPLISSDGEKMYLRSVSREQVAVVIDALFKFYKQNRRPDEGLGAFNRRVGADALIRHLQEDPATKALMEKPAPTDCVLE